MNHESIDLFVEVDPKPGFNTARRADNLPEETAEKLLEEMGLLYPPIDPFLVARECGLSITHGSFSQEEIMGFYEAGPKRITVSHRLDHSAALSFIVAHALGHALLFEGDLVIKPINLSVFSHQVSRRSADANLFADSLLMPQKQFASAVMSLQDISMVANLFAVQESDVWRRINYLKKAS